jgi:hypothetical protein
MMSRLEFFDKGYGLISVKLGFTNPRFLWLYDIYKTYQMFIETGMYPTSEARQRTMKALKENYLNVARAIYWFEREGWTDKKPLSFRNAENNRTKALLK